MSNKKHKIFLKIAKEFSKMSKCQSIKVAAIFVRDGRIISTGINGSPSGLTNCSDLFNSKDIKNIPEERENHHKFSEDFEVHAEINAILHAAKEGISLKGCDIYCTLHPCNKCMKNLVGLGIKNIYYIEKYDRMDISDYNKILIDNINLIQIKNVR